MHDNFSAAMINIKGLWEPIVMVWMFDYWHPLSIACHPTGQIAHSIYYSIGIFNAVQTSHWSCYSVQYLLRNSWCAFSECCPNMAGLVWLILNGLSHIIYGLVGIFEAILMHLWACRYMKNSKRNNQKIPFSTNFNVFHCRITNT